MRVVELSSYCVTTAIKIQANRRNSFKSTGPKTPEGKRIASQNACKLGIFSRELLLRDENELELQMLARGIRADLQPAGPMEHMLVELIISVLWRLRRLLRIEAGIFEMYKVYKDLDGGVAVAFAHDSSQLDCLSRLDRAGTSLERRLYRAIQELQTLQRTRRTRSEEAIDVAVRELPRVSNQQDSISSQIGEE
jgi:hypothetical protein